MFARRLLRSESSRRLLTSLALAGAAASVAGLGTFAAFTSSTSASRTDSTGTVTVGLGSAGGVDNRLTINASGLAPGDTVQRVVKLTNSGSLDLSAVSLTTSATTSSLLDTDATDGLQLEIDRCSVAWTEAGSSPAYTYTCGGSTTSVVSSRPVIGSNVSLGSLSSLTAGQSDYLRIKLTLPSSAGNSFQGLSSTVQYTFTGTQRAATSK